jgi:ribokinase
MSSRVLVAGSANLDFVVHAPRIPAPGETVLGGAFQTHPGGKGANQALACARMGAPTAMLLALGDDAYAAPLEASLREAGIELHIVRVPDAMTGTAFICVSDSAENAITVAPGANSRLGAEHLPALQGFSHLLLQLETPLPAVQAMAERARRAGLTVMLNAAPARPLPAELLHSIDWLVVNEEELAQVSGIAHDVDAALAALPVANAVVTLGSRGARSRLGTTFRDHAAYRIQAVDTTAAGDTFCGALGAGLATGLAPEQALAQAGAAAALACTREGAQTSIPHRPEVRALLETHG